MNSDNRHGEFKPPGEKLVVADLAVGDGRLTNVMISGDFFVYPDHVIHSINRALVGAPVSATHDDLADRIRAALSHDVEMLGVTPESIAEAVRRALA